MDHLTGVNAQPVGGLVNRRGECSTWNIGSYIQGTWRPSAVQHLRLGDHLSECSLWNIGMTCTNVPRGTLERQFSQRVPRGTFNRIDLNTLGVQHRPKAWWSTWAKRLATFSTMFHVEHYYDCNPSPAMW